MVTNVEQNEVTQANEGGTARPVSPTERVRQGAADAYETARQKTSALYGSARDRASGAVESTRNGIDSNPAAALVGGLAIGALVAAILPRTQREAAVLGGVGKRLNQSALGAAEAAREAGREKLEEFGLTREGARQRFTEFTSSAGEALRTSAEAAAGSVRKRKG